MKVSAIFLWISCFIVSSVFFGLTKFGTADFPVYNGDQAEEELQAVPPFAKTDVQPVYGAVTIAVPARFQSFVPMSNSRLNGFIISQVFPFINSRPPPA